MFGKSEKSKGIAGIAEGRSDLHRVDPRKLVVRQGWNSRNFDDPANIEHIEMLAASIAVKGVVEPIKVQWDKGVAYIINGECRWRGCMLAIERGTEIKTVPVIVDERHGNDADRLFTQYLSNTGKPFTALETARNFGRLLDLGWNQEDIAKRAGKTQGWVSQILALLTAPVAVQTMITNGQVSPSLAMEIVRQEGPTAAEATLKAGMEAAASEGKTKVTRQSVGRKNLKTVIVEMLDSGHIDDADEECVVLKVPADKWNALKDVLKY